MRLFAAGVLVSFAPPARAENAVERQNVLGTPLLACSPSNHAGFHRDGFCRQSAQDGGRHVVCAIVTEAFLSFTKDQGNDLSTPTAFFPGLKPGDRWCLCASRWRQALAAKVAPPVVLEATDKDALQILAYADLKEHAAAP